MPTRPDPKVTAIVNNWRQVVNNASNCDNVLILGEMDFSLALSISRLLQQEAQAHAQAQIQVQPQTQPQTPIELLQASTDWSRKHLMATSYHKAYG